MEIKVKNRFSGEVQFTAEIETDSEENSIRLGLAVIWARENKAYLSDTYLSDTYLSGANLSGAYLSGAYLEHNKTVIFCQVGDYSMFLHQGKERLMIKAGCRYFSLEAAKKHWSENKEIWTHKTYEYGERQLRMLDFLESEAKELWK